MIEGFSQLSTTDQQFVQARAHASNAREFHLDPQATGVMSLGRDASDSPSGTTWDGIALVIFIIEKG